MGCNCKRKSSNWKANVARANLNLKIEEYRKQNNIPPDYQLDINLLPDHLLTPIQLRSKKRHFRILARQKRIERRNNSTNNTV